MRKFLRIGFLGVIVVVTLISGTPASHSSPVAAAGTNSVFSEPKLDIEAGNASNIDSDGDGCTDAEELGGSPAGGGMRDPGNFWDFFDVPTGLPAERNRSIIIGDILAIVQRFGTAGDPDIKPLSPAPLSGYHTAFDRSAPSPGDAPWNLQPPDGSITIGDILAVVTQFGHACTGEDGLATAPYEMFENMTGHSWLELEEFIADSIVPIAMDIGAGNEAVRVASGEISVACVDEETGSKSYNLNVPGPSWGVDEFLPGDTATLPPSWQEDGIENEETEGLVESSMCSGTEASTAEVEREAMHSGCRGTSLITEPSSSQVKNLARTNCNWVMSKSSLP